MTNQQPANYEAQKQGDNGVNTNPALQYGISVAIGVLTILLLSASYYYGIFH
jgi:ElaB/YqjD/DUF883 family membrane-anchored ribosome-binding protein